MSDLVSPRVRVRGWLLAVAGLAVLVPVIAIGALSSLLGAQEGAVCGAGAPAGAGMFAAPLLLRPGRWYEVGATEYGGPDDPSSGDYGAIPDPGEAFLPAHPDSFAELSVLDNNPADHGAFTFADANALGNLPYLSALRVQSSGRELVLEKRDIGYGQGPGQTIAGGEPYRLDVWWQAAKTLGVTKGPVRVALAPAGGTAATLEALPSPAPATSGGDTCEGSGPRPGVLRLVDGASARVLPSGLAGAPEGAPATVKSMIARR